MVKTGQSAKMTYKPFAEDVRFQLIAASVHGGNVAEGFKKISETAKEVVQNLQSAGNIMNKIAEASR